MMRVGAHCGARTGQPRYNDAEGVRGVAWPGFAGWLADGKLILRTRISTLVPQ